MQHMHVSYGRFLALSNGKQLHAVGEPDAAQASRVAGPWMIVISDRHHVQMKHHSRTQQALQYGLYSV